MANNYFRFKQFTVKMEGVGMKVGTDGVLLGAWAGEGSPSAILDVGTGTGLIALMMAQRFPQALIHAVEADEAAFKLATDNISSSPWPTSVQVFHSLYQNFSSPGNIAYDLIVSNPPFFTGSLKSPQHQRTIARHDILLPREELIAKAFSQLSSVGQFRLILPVSESALFIESCLSVGLYCNKKVYVYPVPGKHPKRVLLSFSKKNEGCPEGELIIEKYGRHSYSEEYRLLTGDFYL